MNSLVTLKLVGLGFAVGAAFGPVNVVLTRVALKRGALAAYSFAFGALVGDILVFAASLSGLAFAVHAKPSFVLLAHLGGNVFLIAIAARSIFTFIRVRRFGGEISKSSRIAYLVAAIVISITSPLTWILWQTVGATLLGTGGTLRLTSRGVLVAVGDLIWFGLWPAIPVQFRNRASERVVRWLGVSADAVILLYGLYGLVSVAGYV